MTAVPDSGHSFFYWNNDPGDTDNPKTVTLDGNQNLPARFDYEVAKNLVGIGSLRLVILHQGIQLQLKCQLTSF